MSRTKKIIVILFASFFLLFSLAFHSSAQTVPGDLNGDGVMNRMDSIYLLYYTFLPKQFPIEQNADYNGDSIVSDRDVFLLLSGNIGDSGDSDDDGTGTLTPPDDGDSSIPSLGPVEIPTSSGTTYSARALSARSPLSAVLSSNTLYLEEKVLLTLNLSDCPLFTSALVQISAGDSVQIQDPKWLVDGDLHNFHNSGQLGVIAFEQESMLSDDIISLELYGIKEAQDQEISVTLTYHDSASNILGTVSTSACITVTERPYILGDVNHDGEVDATDGQMLLRHLNGWEQPIAYPESMDVNEDGKVDSLDGLILLRYVNGWDISLGRR